MTAHLLVETDQGEVVAVRFPSVEAARSWEDQNPDLAVRGVARSVTKSEALKVTA